MTSKNMSLFLVVAIAVSTLLFQAQAQPTFLNRQFGPFNQSYYATFAVLTPATISNGALQVTPDSAGNFTLLNRSGRIFYNHSFTLWTTRGVTPASKTAKRVASFNASFLVNVFQVNGSITPGEGLAFLVAPGIDLPAGSDGQYLGLTNSTTDGNSTNQIVAVELDTLKEGFDPDTNHLGIDVNSVRSVKTVSLADHGIEIAPAGTVFHVVWVEYDGDARALSVYMAKQPQEADGEFVIRPRPSAPLINKFEIDLGETVAQKSYFGFAASTGSAVQLNCILRWNLTVELLPEEEVGGTGSSGAVGLGLVIGLSVGAVLVAMVIAGFGYVMWRRKRAAADDPTIMGALKSLPGMPREFKLRELKKATNDFDEKRNKLGQGGFGVVFKGWLSGERLEIAVKRFSRDNLKGKDDFLAELTIINRLRHKHLVRLLGWCHKNGTLLLVYEYMPNGSLDSHLFCGPEKAALSWELRYKIVSGVASALNYLHNEYDQTVVHRDLKASNVMLDAHFNARLGDFGLARAIENERTSYADIDAAGVPGTMGYIAPECFHTGRATRESDVYGLGAVILEVVCGLRPATRREGFQFVADWVWWLHREGCVLRAVDERLGSDYAEDEAERLLMLGLACSQPDATKRPTTRDVVQILSGSVAVPHVPPFRPAFVWPSAMPEIGLDSNGSYIDSAGTSSITTGSSWRVGISGP